MKRLSILLLGTLALGSCSLALDFEDVAGLPCPCDADHVCLTPSQTCRKRGSVERFKSCDLGADRPDDLCEAGTICEPVNGVGRRCLPMCTPSTYSTPEAALAIAAQCPTGYTCWKGDERGLGVCSEGICDDLRQDCPFGQNCVDFNGAGVCFTPCEIFRTNPAPCAANQVCHPIGSSSFTACIDAGDGLLGDICNETELCAPRDATSRARPMVCDKPEGSNDRDRRCRAICQCPQGAQFCDNTECGLNAACARARANVDPARSVGLGLCIE